MMIAGIEHNYNKFSPTISLSEEAAHVWKIPLNSQRRDLPQLWMVLSEDEKERARRFRFQKDKECFITSRGVLRVLLGKYLQRKPSSLVFSYGENGKPFLQTQNSLQFNVSHTNDLALIGFIQYYPLGIDVEWIKDDIELKDLARRFFSNNESNKLLTFSEGEIPEAFFNCWTRKEAFIKAKGDGLSFPLDQFEVTMTPGEKASLLATHWSQHEKDKWELYSFDFGENYAAAMAIEGSTQQIEIFEW